jgi:hypothetical protein
LYGLPSIAASRLLSARRWASRLDQFLRFASSAGRIVLVDPGAKLTARDRIVDLGFTETDIVNR